MLSWLFAKLLYPYRAFGYNWQTNVIPLLIPINSFIYVNVTKVKQQKGVFHLFVNNEQFSRIKKEKFECWKTICSFLLQLQCSG